MSVLNRPASPQDNSAASPATTVVAHHELSIPDRISILERPVDRSVRNSINYHSNSNEKAYTHQQNPSPSDDSMSVSAKSPTMSIDNDLDNIEDADADGDADADNATSTVTATATTSISATSPTAGTSTGTSTSPTSLNLNGHGEGVGAGAGTSKRNITQPSSVSSTVSSSTAWNSLPRLSSLSLLYPDTAPRGTWRPQLDAWMKKNHPAKLREISQSAAPPRIHVISKDDHHHHHHHHHHHSHNHSHLHTNHNHNHHAYSNHNGSTKRHNLARTDEISPKLPSPPPESPINHQAHQQPATMTLQPPLPSQQHPSLKQRPPSPPMVSNQALVSSALALQSIQHHYQKQITPHHNQQNNNISNQQQEPQYTVATFSVSNYSQTHKRRCISCGSDQSPCWRPSWSASAGQLCNSCGLRYKKTGARCISSDCGRIPAKGEWVTMKRNAVTLASGQTKYSCLTCGGDVEVGERND